MRVRKLDVNHDWCFGKGQNDCLQGNGAIAQNINTRLSAFSGDCFFDLLAGVDWLNLLGGKDKVALVLAVQAVILNTSGVTSLIQFGMNLDSNRNITLTYQASTIYSTVGGAFTFYPSPANRVVLEQFGFLLI